MKVYLDNCCFNRPFDNQERIKIYLETQAKLHIQKLIRQEKLELIWSFILDIENRDNPYRQKRKTIQEWEKIAVTDISYSDDIYNDCLDLIQSKGIKPKGSLHIVSAYYGKSSYFITTDKEICKKLKKYETMIILNPIDFIKIIEEIEL